MPALEPAPAPLQAIDDAPRPLPAAERLRDLGLVLWVALAAPIAGSVYFLVGGTAPTTPMQQALRLVGALVQEVTALLVLWYVLRRRGGSWKDLGWAPGWRDLLRGPGLYLGIVLVTGLGWWIVQYAWFLALGHGLQPRSLAGILGFGVNALSISFICLNAFYEELIVRAYVTTELSALGAGRALAAVVSVAVQVSYHLYQGLANCVVLAMTFGVLAAYFARTRRIVPVILVHLAFDMVALLTGKS